MAACSSMTCLIPLNDGFQSKAQISSHMLGPSQPQNFSVFEQNATTEPFSFFLRGSSIIA